MMVKYGNMISMLPISEKMNNAYSPVSSFSYQLGAYNNGIKLTNATRVRSRIVHILGIEPYSFSMFIRQYASLEVGSTPTWCWAVRSRTVFAQLTRQ